MQTILTTELKDSILQPVEPPRQTWRIIPLASLTTPKEVDTAHRLNALGSLYYFLHIVLRRHKTVPHLHLEMCLLAEKDNLKEVIEIPRDHFKAVAVDTLIPTPLGFKKMLDIQKGDQVYSLDGSITEVIGTSEVKTNTKCYKVTFSTGDEIIADAGHLWVTDVRRLRANLGLDKAYKESTTEELAKTVIYTTKLCRKTGNTYPEYNHRIPVTKPIKNYEQTYRIHPYVLGAWLGDGDTAGGSLTSENDIIPGICAHFGETVYKRSAKYRYGVVDNFVTKLRGIGVLGNKHIPKQYLIGSETQRLHLLQGLMDTDGSISKEGQCSFSNTNRKLSEQTRILAASLGFKPSSIGTYIAKLNGRECGNFYVFTFYPTIENNPFLLPNKRARVRECKNSNTRQIIAIEPCDSVPVKCISVAHKSEMFLVGESFIPTHNSTVYSEACPMWWALPFSPNDEFYMRSLGYDDRFIKWMHRAHNQNTRTLLVSETIDNAIKLGMKIDNHYKSNDLFRRIFPEIMPDSSCTWTNKSMIHKRTSEGNYGEGTYDFLGVGGALQSRHYVRVLQDDLVGRDALKSEIVMNDTIEYHKLLVGAFDADDSNGGKDNDEIVVGNRWSYRDLNSHIREFEKQFSFHNHSATGGCCRRHPFGQPIFPELFSLEKLEGWRGRLGSYLYSCQFLNDPLPPGTTYFKESDLRYFEYDFSDVYIGDKGERNARIKITHEVKNGEAIPDVQPGLLQRSLVVDPNHSGTDGRCRHAITVTGRSENPERIYLLDCWAEASTYDVLINKIYELCLKWKLREFWLETVAAQKYLKYHLEYLFKVKDIRLKVCELKTDRTANGKDTRIQTLQPLLETGRFWCRKSGQENFIQELVKYSPDANNTTVDILDTLGYAPQTWKGFVSQDEVVRFMSQHRTKTLHSMSQAGY